MITSDVIAEEIRRREERDAQRVEIIEDTQAIVVHGSQFGPRTQEGQKTEKTQRRKINARIAQTVDVCIVCGDVANIRCRHCADENRAYCEPACAAIDWNAHRREHTAVIY